MNRDKPRNTPLVVNGCEFPCRGLKHYEVVAAAGGVLELNLKYILKDGIWEMRTPEPLEGSGK